MVIGLDPASDIGVCALLSSNFLDRSTADSLPRDGLRADAPAALGWRAEVWEVGSGGREEEAAKVYDDTRFGLDAVEGRGGRPNERRGVGVAISGSILSCLFAARSDCLGSLDWLDTPVLLAFRTTYFAALGKVYSSEWHNADASYIIMEPYSEIW